MIYNFKTKKALKFLLWLCVGADAFLYCFFLSLKNSDPKMIIIGAFAALLQIAHGVRVAFYNKTLVNMSLGFCKFQFILLLIYALVASLELGGIYGIILFAVTVLEFVVSLMIPLRRRIADGVKEFLLI